jgi:hypothetical protein
MGIAAHAALHNKCLNINKNFSIESLNSQGFSQPPRLKSSNLEPDSLHSFTSLSSLICMEAKQVIAKAQSSLSESLDRAGARCVMLEGSEFLFLERTNDADLTLSKETVRELSSLNSVASEDSVVLLGGNHRVEALVGLSRVADMSIKDFSMIRTIGLVPQLAHRLGAWKRQKRIRDDFWSVIFETQHSSDGILRDKLESLIVKPWVARRKVHSSFAVPSKSKKLFPDTDFDVLYFQGHGHREAMWECKLVTADHIDPSDYDGETTFGASGQVVIHRLPIDWHKQLDTLAKLRVDKLIIFDCCDIETDDEEGRNGNKPHETTSGISNRPEREGLAAASKVDSSAVVERVESATEALDAVLLTLTSPSDDVVDRDEGPETNASARSYDPVRKAIEIREKLHQSVNFVDSATWAKARGNRSNPSAALGKYKRKGRIFSVRSGKRDLYPTFQFADNTAEPLPVIEEILQAVPKEAQGWPLLSWFEAKNVLLSDRKPSQVLASEPDAVLRAAVRFYSRDD